MSSIYKKGRDGYYYYQTYVYNPETKKMDKRVFHALRTKDLIEAQTKQNELDLKYDKQKKSNPILPRLDYHLSLKSTMVIIAGLIFMATILVELFRLVNVKQNVKPLINQKKDELIQENIDVVSKIYDTFNSEIKEQIDSIVEDTSKETKKTLQPKPMSAKIIIPEYTIERIDRMSGAFEQGKLYVTININSSSESQRLLCKNLAKRFNEFSNIVICLYANNLSGKSLAKGDDQTVSMEEQKRSWLAMYTYNSVEGEYFDSNPSSYLGIY